MAAKACSLPIMWRPYHHNEFETRPCIDAQEIAPLTFLQSLVELLSVVRNFQILSYLSKKPASFVLYKTFSLWTKITYCCDTHKMIERGNKRMTNDHKLAFFSNSHSTF